MCASMPKYGYMPFILLFAFQREKRSHDYFPFERALVLTNQEEERDQVAVAMESMARKIEYLVQKTKEHVRKWNKICSFHRILPVPDPLEMGIITCLSVMTLFLINNWNTIGPMDPKLFGYLLLVTSAWLLLTLGSQSQGHGDLESKNRFWSINGGRPAELVDMLLVISGWPHFDFGAIRSKPQQAEGRGGGGIIF